MLKDWATESNSSLNTQPTMGSSDKKHFLLITRKVSLGFDLGLEPLGMAQADALYGAHRLPPQFSIRSCPATRVFVRTVSWQAGTPSCLECLA